jgi:hypothetical protein
MLTDDDLRRELTAAFHEQADPIAWTALQPTALFRQAVRHRRRRAGARAGSVMAAAAAVAAIVSLVALPGRPTAGPATTAGPAGTLLAAAVTTPPPASAAARGMPPFYLVADHDQPAAVVRASATGQIISRVPLPSAIDPKLTQVTAAGDERTFVLALSLSRGTQFYQLRITASGRPAGLTRLAIPPLPVGEAADAIALTPDGARLAVAIQTAGTRGQIEVITLASGAVRRWASTTSGGLPENLSWDGAGRRLAFFWSGAAASKDGLWLLDTRAKGTGLPSGRRLLPETVGPDEVQSALVTPDARTVIASVTYNGTMKVGRGTVVGGIVEVSAQTARPLRTLLAEHAAYSSDGGGNRAGWYVTTCQLGAIDRTGSHLLVSCDQFGRLDRGRFTAVPAAAPQTDVAAAW